ncbi:hypothetical protein TrVFT333_009751 [Trichoderma virens FT-333]|nr:hypothetical protein TrVFT333_009751 [Trichoderma virens FT-333]
MFSEYASRFLAQSQSRLSNFGQADNDSSSRPNDWSSRPTRPYRDAGRGNGGQRSLLGRGYGGNPYQNGGGAAGGGSRFGQLAFGSRITAAQDAPLFHSTLDEFREEDDEEERDREAADLFALQRSRRVAAASKLADSVESDANSRGSLEESSRQFDHPYRAQGFGRGIKSSWNGTRSSHHTTVAKNTPLEEEEAEEVDHDSRDGESDRGDGNHRGNMVDVGLDSQEDADDDPPESLLEEATDNSPRLSNDSRTRLDERRCWKDPQEATPTWTARDTQSLQRPIQLPREQHISKERYSDTTLSLRGYS